MTELLPAMPVPADRQPARRARPAAPVSGPPAEIDLAAAIKRLGGNVEVYRDLLPGLRKDAANMAAVAAELVTDGLRPEAQLMYRTLRGIARAMGACALGRLAAQAEHLMGRDAGAEDARVLGQLTLALVRGSIHLERALHRLDAGSRRQPRKGDFAGVRARARVARTAAPPGAGGSPCDTGVAVAA